MIVDLGKMERIVCSWGLQIVSFSTLQYKTKTEFRVTEKNTTYFRILYKIFVDLADNCEEC